MPGKEVLKCIKDFIGKRDVNNLHLDTCAVFYQCEFTVLLAELSLNCGGFLISTT